MQLADLTAIELTALAARSMGCVECGCDWLSSTMLCCNEMGVELDFWLVLCGKAVLFVMLTQCEHLLSNNIFCAHDHM